MAKSGRGIIRMWPRQKGHSGKPEAEKEVEGKTVQFQAVHICTLEKSGKRFESSTSISVRLVCHSI